MTLAARPLLPPDAANTELALSAPAIPSLEGIALGALIATVAQQRPAGLLFNPPGDTPARNWAEVAHESRWIARMLQTVTRDQPATVLLPMALDSRAMIALLGCFLAGKTPMLVRPDLDVEAMTAKAEQIGATVAIGASPDASLPTLGVMREMAARSFGMRCVAGFGADVPEGVVPLDRLMRDLAGIGETPDTAPRRQSAMGSLFLDGDPPALASESDLLAAAFDIARSLRVQPEARVVTTMTGGSLAALASGLGLAVIAGAELVPLGVFSLTGLWSSFAGGQPVHLVIPAEIEAAMQASGMLAHRGLASVVLVHRARPERLPLPAARHCRVFDIGPSSPTRLVVRERT